MILIVRECRLHTCAADARAVCTDVILSCSLSEKTNRFRSQRYLQDPNMLVVIVQV